MKSPIKKDEQVVLFPSFAYLDGQCWVVPIHGWIFEPERGSLWRRAFVRTLMGVLDISTKGVRGSRFRERVGWFLVDNERGKRIPLHVGGERSLVSSRSRADGHFYAQTRIPTGVRREGSWISVIAKTRSHDKRTFQGKSLLVPPKGVSVVSDIDDTIKITEVTSRRTLLERTFLRDFEVVPGMNELYKQWHARGAVFHYVSASPWHLYAPLTRFFEQMRFPLGTFDLREFRVKDRRIAALLRSPRKYKMKAIQRWIRQYPQRRFVLVGDAFEKDPEIFGDLARQYPKQIVRILIRYGIDQPMTAARKKTVFVDLMDKVDFFSDPAQLSSCVRNLQFYPQHGQKGCAFP